MDPHAGFPKPVSTLNVPGEAASLSVILTCTEVIGPVVTPLTVVRSPSAMVKVSSSASVSSVVEMVASPVKSPAVILIDAGLL